MKHPKAGIYEKFRVERTDGQSAPGGKHDGCSYFVLDVTHDPYAIPALKKYAEVCEAIYPALAQDIRAMLAGRLRAPFPVAPPAGQESEP